MTLKLEQILELKTETGNPTQIIKGFAKFSFKNCLRHFAKALWSSLHCTYNVLINIQDIWRGEK